MSYDDVTSAASAAIAGEFEASDERESVPAWVRDAEREHAQQVRRSRRPTVELPRR